MSYRTFKRAFGETNLERKCRLLFGVCLGLLIFGAFLWVARIGEGLVKQNTEQIGKDWVNMAVIHLHWMVWETDEKKEPFLQEITRDLLPKHYEWTTLSLGADDVPWQHLPDGKPPESGEERQKLVQLREKWRAQLAAALQAPETADVDKEPADANAEATAADIEPVIETLTLPSEGKYCVYQPIYWRKSCKYCHGPIVGAFPASETALSREPPFRVMKLIIPYEETKKAVYNTRAVLISAAILTVFVAMVMLYVIVRYVIVKPLKHSAGRQRGDQSRQHGTSGRDPHQ